MIKVIQNNSREVEKNLLKKVTIDLHNKNTWLEVEDEDVMVLKSKDQYNSVFSLLRKVGGKEIVVTYNIPSLELSMNILRELGESFELHVEPSYQVLEDISWMGVDTDYKSIPVKKEDVSIVIKYTKGSMYPTIELDKVYTIVIEDVFGMSYGAISDSIETSYIRY